MSRGWAKASACRLQMTLYCAVLWNNHNLDVRSSLSELGITTDRFNNDLMITSNGLHLIDICKSFDLRIINGRFGDDKETVEVI